MLFMMTLEDGVVTLLDELEDSLKHYDHAEGDTHGADEDDRSGRKVVMCVVLHVYIITPTQGYTRGNPKKIYCYNPLVLL